MSRSDEVRALARKHAQLRWMPDEVRALRDYADLLAAAEELLRLRDAEVTAFPDARYLKAWDRLRKLVRP